ncbi:MAG: methyltransferase domain-containing protein [Azospirillaceae bacterium]|nr:methyltransferase domain-containing protein [Azospirillaceae bacterium]
MDMNDARYWDGLADYRKLAHDFTVFYAQRAWELADLPHGATVLDIAAGAGALALTAAHAGAKVLATDFSRGMIEAVLSHRLPNLEAKVMDGQALDLPDEAFDAAFSMFGIMLFADWRKGLREMARVVRSGGIGSVGSWKEPTGAAGNILLAQHLSRLFPDIVNPVTIEGMNEFRQPERFVAAMMEAGFGDVSIVEVSQDFMVDGQAFGEPDRLFQFNPVWPLLEPGQRDAIVLSIHGALESGGGILAVPSPALIATARRV